jgi:hypothetical protein
MAACCYHRIGCAFVAALVWPATGLAQNPPPGTRTPPVVGAQARGPLDQPLDRPLGWLSKSEEVGDRGPGTVSSGIGDKGGPSYGSFQLSSESRNGAASNVEQFVRKYYADQFAGLEVNSPMFQQTWNDLGQGANARDFHAKQHRFIQNTHYDPVVRDLQDDLGIDPVLRSAALQNVIWSTAVQHGRKGGSQIIEAAIRCLARSKPLADLIDEDIIRAIYAERARSDAQGKLVQFKSKETSDETRATVARRFRREQAAALTALADERQSPRRRLLDQAKARQKGLSKKVQAAAEQARRKAMQDDELRKAHEEARKAEVERKSLEKELSGKPCGA